MVRILYKLLLTSCLAMVLFACAKHSLYNESYLQQGKRYFQDGYYKRAMQDLLPLATDGNDEAQYAVGYMYYYGYGVAQDTQVGHFWIKRSAEKGFEPAKKALEMIQQEGPAYSPGQAKYPTSSGENQHDLYS